MDPDHPDQAVLERTFFLGDWDFWLFASALPLLAGGFQLALWLGVRLGWRTPYRRKLDWKPPRPADLGAGPLLLVPRAKGLHWSLQICLWVVGFVSYLGAFYFGLGLFLDGEPSVIEQTARGVGLVAMAVLPRAVYRLFRSFEPQPVLTLSRGVLRPGESAVLEWWTAPGLLGFRKLGLVLEGREEATSGRGSSSTTDKAVFFQQQLAKDIPEDSGSAGITLPPDAYPSFRGGNNQVSWGFRVDLEVPWFGWRTWDFEVNVAPAELDRGTPVPVEAWAGSPPSVASSGSDSFK